MDFQYSLDSLPQAVQQVAQALHGLSVITFKGNLGAGKTTLIRGLCQYFGVASASISSPTFSIINEYLPGKNFNYDKIYHMDWYRLKSLEEACQAGVEDALQDPHGLCFIEWPEQVPELLTMPYLEITVLQGATDEAVRSLQLLPRNILQNNRY